MPFVLDTDILSILGQRSQPEYAELSRRLALVGPQAVAVTIISFQEQIQGWMAYLKKSRSDEHLVRAYAKLVEVLRDFADMSVLPLDRVAQDHFNRLRKQGLRLGTMDLRIASIALGTNSTLITRNVRDFSQVPGLAVEDWTR